MIKPDRIQARIIRISKIKNADAFIQHLKDRMLLTSIHTRVRNSEKREELGD